MCKYNINIIKALKLKTDCYLNFKGTDRNNVIQKNIFIRKYIQNGLAKVNKSISKVYLSTVCF